MGLVSVALGAASCTSILGDFKSSSSEGGTSASAAAPGNGNVDSEGGGASAGGKLRGAACSVGTECATGLCSDAVCCDSACDGVCEKCNSPSSVGQCSPIPVNTDPEMECVVIASRAADAAEAGPGLGNKPPDGGISNETQCAGSCDGKGGHGAGSCVYPDSTKSCGTPFCNTSSQRGEFVCDGAGHCQPILQPCQDSVSPATRCQEAACSGGACTTSNAAVGTACSDANGKLCDGKGTCVACLSGSDCAPTGTSCATVACALGACANTNAAKGTVCSDGTGVICDGLGKCVEAHCSDGIKDADETDVDCGGASCSGCGVGQACLSNKDCLSGEGCDVVALKCDINTCKDGMKDGTETDVDCGGGTCPTCGNDKKCGVPGDCAQYLLCMSNVCVREPESDCLDGIDNNGDGLADCQDPTCAGTVVGCMPIGPGGSQLGVLNTTCPSGFGPGVQEYAGFHEGSCSGCTCSINASCQLHVNWRQSPSSGCSGTPQDIYLTGSAGGTSNCVTLSGVSDDQIYAFGVTTQSENCVVGGSASYSTGPHWDVSTSFCPAMRTSETCASGQICALVPAPAKMCVEIPGNVACPAGYTSPTQYYAGFSAGGCSACPASCSPGSNGCGATVSTYGFTDNCCGCLATNGVGPFPTNMCSSFGASNVSSANAVFSIKANDCSVGQSSANASTLNSVTTICCM